MTAQPEALRLADELDADRNWLAARGLHQQSMAEASAELRRLHADAEESEALRERLSALLRNTAIALRGPEPELTRWSWHDLPELATALKAQRDALLEALKSTGLFLHHCWCDVQMNDHSFEKLNRQMEIVDAAIKAVEGEKA